MSQIKQHTKLTALAIALDHIYKNLAYYNNMTIYGEDE